MKPKGASRDSFLNRYTTLPFLFDVLVNKRIVLVSPTSWEDRNDSYYLERYKASKKLRTLVALCFSKKRETFHHWKVFAAGPSGVCIEFDKELLLFPMREMMGFSLRDVEYRLIKDVIVDPPKRIDWPFIKRMPFKDEGEFRLIFESKSTNMITKSVPIQLSCIRRVTLSPWMPKSVADTIIAVINRMVDCDRFSVKQSSLLEPVMNFGRI